jgi:serine/threonine protein kinase/sugar lactone lactonase YvrE
MSQRPGTKLGPYEIVSLLGAGSMGEVYRAYDPRLRREVALKVLTEKVAEDFRSEDRFAGEARAASALNHPNIVSIYDIGHWKGVSYIVSELVQGESLSAILDRGPMTPEKVCEIGSQIASGLAAAHARGIVHRDLKPSNIMLTGEGWAKIIDFGLAKQTALPNDDSTRMSMTGTGNIVGTLAYMSPEQVRSRPLDARSDIFSLGVVLYEMASGRRPFEGGDSFKIMQEIVLQEPPSLHVPPKLATIIQRCLRKDPAERFQDAGELASALRNRGRVSAATLTAVTRPLRTASWLVLAAGVIALLIGGGLVFRTAFLKPKTTETQPASLAPPAQASIERKAETDVPAPPARTTPIPIEKVEKKPTVTDSDPKVDVKPKIEVPRLPVIETFAGREWHFSGDGRSALEAPLGRSYGVTTDSNGNIYQTDLGNNVLVQIDSNGKLHVLLGPENGVSGPIGIVVNAEGEILFGEDGRVRKRLPGGSVVLVAGAARRGSSADGVNAIGAPLSNIHGVALAPDGSVVFAEWGNNRVRRVDSQGRLQTVAGDGQGRFAGDGGLATQASLLHPSGIAFDRQGNLFIADQNNGRIRQVGTDGRIRTVAGLGVTVRLGCPTGVAVNRKNELFIADPCKRQVFVLRSGRLTVLGGTGSGRDEPSGDGGPATAASFDEWALAMDDHDNLLISGPSSGHAYRITDGTFKVVSGNGKWRTTSDGTPAREAVFTSVFRIALDPEQNLVISDPQANLLYRIDRKGFVYQVAGQQQRQGYRENGSARESYLNQPNGLRVQRDGTILFVDSGNHRIRKVTPDGSIKLVAGNGQAAYRGDGGSALDASLNGPVGLAVDSAGNIYVADANNNRIRKITPDGKIQLVAGNGQQGFSGDGGPPELAALNSPRGVEVGPDGAIYICDSQNRRVRRVLGGVITTIAGNGKNEVGGDGGPGVSASIQFPMELAFGPDQTLYILDGNGGQIRRLDSSGIIETVAGNGQPASGDGGSPLQAGLGAPRGLAIDSTGTIYVSDSVSSVVRVIRLPAR